jgi:peptide/nickel transport system substrate-binding protein
MKRLPSLLAAALLVATACTGSSSNAGASPKNGGTLLVALDGDMGYADPSLVSDGNSLYVAAQVVQGLVGLKPGTIATIIPVLAASLPTVGADGKTYTFTLRTGIKFHDGTAFDAAAVKFNYDRWKAFPTGDLQDNAYYYGAVFGGFGANSNIVSIDAPDATTVVFHLNKPQSNFLLASTLQVFGIQSPAALARDKADTTPLSGNKYAQGQGESMVGTGPFKFSEWVPGDHVKVVKNADYWDTKNAAHLDTIVFQVNLSTSTSKLQALQSGSTDLAETISPTDVKTAKDSGVKIVDRGQSCNLGYLGLNQVVGGTPTIYADKNVRLAVAQALNKKAYIKTFYADQGDVPKSWLPAGTEGYKPETLPGYDVTKAKASLTAAGLSGSQLTIDLYYPSNVVRPYMPDPKNLAQAIAGDLQAIGFTVNLKTEGWREGYVTDATTGKFPLYLFGWTCDWAGADNFLYTAWFGYQDGKPNAQFGWKNDAANQKMLQALEAPSADQAKTLWGDVQDLLAADMPTVPIVNSRPPGAYTSKVHGFVGAGNAIEYFNTVWID